MVHKSLVKKITTGGTTVIVGAFCIALFANYWYTSAQHEKAHKNQLELQLDLISQSLESPLWSLDVTTTRLIGEAYTAGMDTAYLEIYSEFSEDPIYSSSKNVKARVVSGREDIIYDGKKIGQVEIGLSAAAHDSALEQLLVYSIILGVSIILSLAYIMRILFRRHLEEPLKEFGVWTDQVAAGEYGAGGPPVDLTELNNLAQKFASMSEQVQARELSLQASESKFRGLFENTETSIWDEDISAVVIALEKLKKEGVSNLREHIKEKPHLPQELAAMVRVLQVNDATLKLFRAQTQEEMLCEINRTFGPGTLDVFIEELCALWNKETSFRSEATYRTLEGKEINAIISFQIPDTEDGFRSLPVSITDITDLKSAEAELVKYRDQLQLMVDAQTQELKNAQAKLIQEERLATLGRLTATVSHELRNPLGTVRNAVSCISEELKDNVPDYLNRMTSLAERNIVRCVNIIEDLLNYTRVKPLDLEETALDIWLQDLISEHTLPAGVNCVQNLTCPLKVYIDREKLRQVLINLITNASDATLDDGSNGKEITISTRPLEDEYEICVHDNGIGMSEETLVKIFEPLFSTKGFGIGLGMVIVRTITEQHHGKIDVSSKLGAGTTVALRLPIQPPF